MITYVVDFIYMNSVVIREIFIVEGIISIIIISIIICIIKKIALNFKLISI